ncbi:MAG: Dam family site-specific DNA-(adenine-N6)-methyltransferase [Helicobacteraceae bacterium]|nr:Dam family site-specific DNA-(adenine-N6)-methyltransferase [Helicobacteraceae bacterium]
MLRSPFFYVGDKYKLMSQLVNLFPKNIDAFFDVFVGGGSVFLNVKAKRFILNDINENLIMLHKELLSYRNKRDELFEKIYKTISDYELSCSFKGEFPSDRLKIDFPKTYFAKYNKNAYIKLRYDYNSEINKDFLKLYLLLIYGFNHMLRFNSLGAFNLPVGNVDFNKNVVNAINNYLNFAESNEIIFSVSDCFDFVKSHNFKSDDFVYFDPPYLISASEYNKLWGAQQETRLYELIDELDRKHIKFGLSNMLEHKGAKNEILYQWSKKYKVIPVKSNYISYNDNSIKSSSKEVYIANYE